MTTPTVPAADPRAERLRGRLMQQSLAALLERVRGAREALPHLAALEASLGRHGSAVIDRIPAPLLQRICAQLASLPLPEDDLPLQDLATRLMDALRAQLPVPEYEPTQVGEKTLVIEDASHTDFMAAERALATTRPADL